MIRIFRLVFTLAFLWGSAEASNLNPVNGEKTPVNDAVSTIDKKIIFQNFRKEPYVIFAADNGEMILLWQLKTPEICNVQWGADLTYSLGNQNLNEDNNDHQYKYVFTGLDVETIYYYKVTVAPDTITGMFKSASSPNNKNLTFFAYGDTRSNPNHHDDVAAQILAETENDPDALTFIVSSGDFVSNGNKESDWDTQFFDSQYGNIRKMMQKLPYLGSMGNHEGNGQLFAKYFPYPFYDGNRYYWSFDYGPAHFTIIDQFTDYKPGSAQYNWMVNDLANAQKQWKFILLHKPGWSAGGGHSNNGDVQDFIQPLCIQYGVQMVIGGHNHYYSCALVDDVIHITAGGGGAPLYNPDATNPNIIKVSKTYNFCKISLSENDLQLLAINDNGDIIHQFSYNDLVSGISSNLVDVSDILIFPNPFSSIATMEFVVKDSGIYKISVYSPSGELIKVISETEHKIGKHEISWDGTDNNGQQTTSGIYYFRIESEGKSGGMHKLVRIRR